MQVKESAVRVGLGQVIRDKASATAMVKAIAASAAGPVRAFLHAVPPTGLLLAETSVAVIAGLTVE
jgi:hypothetical protein